MVVGDGLRAFIADTVTGKILADLPVEQPRWGARINGPGPVSAQIPANALELADFNLRDLTSPWNRSLGFSYGDDILECGPIEKRRFRAVAGRLEVSGSGIWNIFNRRKALLGRLLNQSEDPRKTPLILGPASRQSIMRELVRISIQSNPYGVGGLPIVLPEYTAGTERRVYQGYDLKWIAEALTELTEEEGGPDLRFKPRFRGDDPTFIEWVMEMGNPILKQRGGNHRWDGSRPESGVVGFDAEEDGANMGSRAWVPGQGSETDMLLAKATNLKLTNAGYPWMEVDNARKQIEDQGVLNRLAARDVANAAGSEMTFGIVVRADADPMLGSYDAGDYAEVVIPEGHPILSRGKQQVRIMGIDGDESNNVTLTLAPFLTSIDGDSSAVTISEAGTEPMLYPGLTTWPGNETYPS